MKILVNMAAVKALVKEKYELRTGGDVGEALTLHIEKILEGAATAAKDAKRLTLQGKDVSGD